MIVHCRFRHKPNETGATQPPCFIWSSAGYVDNSTSLHRSVCPSFPASFVTHLVKQHRLRAMPFMLARHGRCIIRQFRVRETLPLSARVSLVPHHVRRVSLAANGLSSKRTAPTGPIRSILSQIQANSYATAGRPKAHTGRAKASTSGSKKGKAGNKKKPAKKSASSKKKTLSPEEKEAQKEAKKAKAIKEEIKQLKVAVLQPPKKLPESPFLAAFQERITTISKEEGKTQREHFKEIAEHIKSLSSYELEVSCFCERQQLGDQC